MSDSENYQHCPLCKEGLCLCDREMLREALRKAQALIEDSIPEGELYMRIVQLKREGPPLADLGVRDFPKLEAEFEKISAPVIEQIKTWGGRITGRVILNSTLRVFIPERYIDSLEDIPGVIRVAQVGAEVVPEEVSTAGRLVDGRPMTQEEAILDKRVRQIAEAMRYEGCKHPLHLAPLFELLKDGADAKVEREQIVFALRAWAVNLKGSPETSRILEAAATDIERGSHYEKGDGEQAEKDRIKELEIRLALSEADSDYAGECDRLTEKNNNLRIELEDALKQIKELQGRLGIYESTNLVAQAAGLTPGRAQVALIESLKATLEESNQRVRDLEGELERAQGESK